MSLTIRYLGALGLIALLSTGAYFSLIKVIETQDNSAAIINLSGRQRMLSQRIAHLAEKVADQHYEASPDENIKPLKRAISLMKQSHEWLTQGNIERGITKAHSKKIHEMYFDEPLNLDHQVRKFITEARKLIDDPLSAGRYDNPHLLYINSVTSAKLLTSLDQIVLQYQIESENHIERLRWVHSTILFITLLTLLIEAIFIFRPMVQNIEIDRQKLIEAEQKTLSILKTVGEGVITIDTKSIIVFVNEELCNIFGYSETELLGRKLDVLIPARYLSKHHSGLRRYLEGGPARILGKRLELEGLRQDGSIFPIELRVEESKLGGDHGRLFIGAIRDIAKRKDAEEAFYRLHTAIESADEMVCVTDNNGYIQYCNPAFERITGYSREEALNKNPRILKSGKHEDSYYTGIWEVITRGDVWKGRFINKKKNGGLYEEIATISPIKNSSGGIIGYVAVKRDVTHELLLEKQFQQAQKYESLGILAGGIAHDFNNLLTTILGNAELALEEIGDSTLAHESVMEIHTATNRAAELSRQMLAYSGKGQFLIEKINLNDIVREMTKLLKSSVSKNVIIQHYFHADLPLIKADVTQIRQVVMNLITNASEAHNEKDGVITITTGVMDCDHVFLKDAYLNEELPSGEYVFLEVLDTGEGMDKETKDKLFDPFFTTKFTGRGLGMAAVLGIIKGHKGGIKVDSSPGIGTRFTIVLPPTAGKEVDEILAPSQTLNCVGTILLVDDEDGVINIGRKILARLGFNALTAKNGEDAIEIFTKNVDIITCVVLDLSMPKMDGGTCFKKLRDIKHDIPVVITSGYDKSDFSRRFDGWGVSEFLQKPFQKISMEQALIKALGASKETAN